MDSFILISNTYETVSVGLFHGNKLIDSITDDKLYISKNSIPLLQTLLYKHNSCLADILFIAANVGPAPYTTLRALLATINGIAFASTKPLVAVDGLEVFAQEFYDEQFTQTALIWNAFNNDVYYAFMQKSSVIKKGYVSIRDFITLAATQFPQGIIRIMGNAVGMHQALLQQALPNRLAISHPTPQYPSLAYLGSTAFKQWQTHNKIMAQLSPLYLKHTYCLT